MDEILKEVFEQFKCNETSYGEPQAFISIEKDRSIEIVKEMEGLDKSEYYYSCRLHCTEEEFDNDEFHSTIGVMDVYCTETISDEQLESGIEYLIKVNEAV